MKAITPEQIKAAAQALDVPVAALRAVMEVECRGSGFNADGTPVRNGRGFSFPKPSPDPLHPSSFSLNRYAVPMVRVHALAMPINHSHPAALTDHMGNFPAPTLPMQAILHPVLDSALGAVFSHFSATPRFSRTKTPSAPAFRPGSRSGCKSAWTLCRVVGGTAAAQWRLD